MKTKKACKILYFGILIFFTAILMIGNPAHAQQKNIILADDHQHPGFRSPGCPDPDVRKEDRIFREDDRRGLRSGHGHGAKGEADVLLVHSPAAEKKFVAEGYGVNRRIIMHNDFIVVGPGEDPAKIKGTKATPDSFKKIAASGALFLSRADKSGTHTKEMGIWNAAGINPDGQKWYQQTGLGMGQTLNVASEKKGYTLADRGTYLALKKNLALDILAEGDAILLNVYHVLEINPAKFPKVNVAGGKAFADFMVSKEVQDIVKTFGVEKFGSPLFFPDAGKKEEELGK